MPADEFALCSDYGLMTDSEYNASSSSVEIDARAPHRIGAAETCLEIWPSRRHLWQTLNWL
jgi:hypothetical protein